MSFERNYGNSLPFDNEDINDDLEPVTPDAILNRSIELYQIEQENMTDELKEIYEEVIK